MSTTKSDKHELARKQGISMAPKHVLAKSQPGEPKHELARMEREQAAAGKLAGVKGPVPPGLLEKRREICALMVRRMPIPRDLRIHQHTSLALCAKRVREEMDETDAPDSMVEALVAKHVRVD